MRRRMFGLLLLSLAVAGQTAIDNPPLARVTDAKGRLTPVYGLAGNFIRGDASAGTPLLAYSHDGVIEWRLEPGRLVAWADGLEAIVPTTETRAVFRGRTAYLGDTLYRLNGEHLEESADAANADRTIAGREIVFVADQRKLLIKQPDGSEDAVPCASEPQLLTAAGKDWAALRIQGQAYLLRLVRGRVELFPLPERREEE